MRSLPRWSRPAPDYPADTRTTGRVRALTGPLLLAAVLVVGACAPAGSRPSFAEETLPTEVASSCGAPAGFFDGFGSAEITVVGPDGLTADRCVLVATDPDRRARGLMEATDLGGYYGMLFVFPAESTGGFWMRNTLLPLSIAFVSADGAVVARLDMQPCPDGEDCPTYAPEAPYLWALEVPQGMLDAFGLVEGARLDPATLPTTQL